MNIIPYGRQDITDDDIRAVCDVLNSDYLTQGPKIAEFESAFAQYVRAKYAVAVSNGTAALHMAAIAVGVKPGCRVITTPITFAASANCVLYCGGEVEFADIDPLTGLIDLTSVENMISAKPAGYYSGLIPVDFAGLPVNMEHVNKIAKKHNLWVIHDACHSPGAFFTDQNRKQQYSGNGAFADCTIFSFHPVKHIATGEGGMITTQNEVIYNSLMKLRTHGITKNIADMKASDGGWYYEMQTLGYNYRMPDMLCALGLSQLKMADERLNNRHSIAKKYDEAFFGNSLITPLTSYKEVSAKGLHHAYHLYIVLTPKRRDLYDQLKSYNIFTQVHYIPVYMMPYYQGLGFTKGLCPQAELYYSQCLSLPMYPTLSESDQEYVINSILKILKD